MEKRGPSSQALNHKHFYYARVGKNPGARPVHTNMASDRLEHIRIHGTGGLQRTENET